MRTAWIESPTALRDRMSNPSQVDNTQPEAGMPPYMESFLAHLRLLVGVPFNYLIADERLLPDESIRFFYIDRSWTDRLVDGIVVNCEFLRRHLREEEKVPAGLIHLCYNGVDTGAFQPQRGARPESLRGASLVVGVVCGLRPEKGLGTLLEAFAAVHGLEPGMKLAIVGSGPCLEDLQARLTASEQSRNEPIATSSENSHESAAVIFACFL